MFRPPAGLALTTCIWRSTLRSPATASCWPTAPLPPPISRQAAWCGSSRWPCPISSPTTSSRLRGLWKDPKYGPSAIGCVARPITNPRWSRRFGPATVPLRTISRRRDTTMQFGFGAPVSGPLSSPDNLARVAVEGEAMGYDYATISDHVVIPRDIEAKYPYSDTGEFPGRAGGDRHEQLTAVAFIAGKTSRLRLVTSVTVVPHRPAVLQAKMLATIDVLSM